MIDPTTKVMVAEQLHQISSDILEPHRRSIRCRQPASALLGMNVIGWIQAQSGLGESARSSIRAATAAGVPTNTIHHLAPSKLVMCEKAPKAIESGPNQIHPVNLIHVNVDHFASYLGTHAQNREVGNYNIGYWVWETLDLPKEWEPLFETIHEIWTPSSFCQELFSQKAGIPVIKIPHNVQPVVDPDFTDSTLGLPDDRFMFLSAMDMLSTPERKNPDGSLEAFIRAFGAHSKEACLVLKISNPNIRPDTMERISQYCVENDSVILITEHMDSGRFYGLLQQCDCYLSLHRAEGFGFPLAESMYFGKPVIATGWSGNMEFMHVGNSLAVQYEIAELEKDAPPYRKGNRWADPDLNHAAHLMRLVVEDSAMARRIGNQAMTDMRTGYSPQTIGRLIRDRLEVVSRICGQEKWR